MKLSGVRVQDERARGKASAQELKLKIARCLLQYFMRCILAQSAFRLGIWLALQGRERSRQLPAGPRRRRAGATPPSTNHTARATTLRVMMWSRGVVFEVVCATEPCSGLVVFHKDCLRTVKLRTCVHQGGVVFEIVGATEPCSGRVIFTRIGCEQSNGGLVSISGRR